MATNQSQAATILHIQVSAVCPIHGVSVADVADRAGWLIDLDSSATSAQIAAAQNVLATFDLAAAVTAELTREQSISADPNLADLENRLASANATQIAQYVQNNVVDLASAKTLLTKILLILADLLV